jgi:hypothetical protein
MQRDDAARGGFVYSILLDHEWPKPRSRVGTSPLVERQGLLATRGTRRSRGGGFRGAYRFPGDAQPDAPSARFFLLAQTRRVAHSPGPFPLAALKLPTARQSLWGPRIASIASITSIDGVRRRSLRKGRRSRPTRL